MADPREWCTEVDTRVWYEVDTAGCVCVWIECVGLVVVPEVRAGMGSITGYSVLNGRTLLRLTQQIEHSKVRRTLTRIRALRDYFDWLPQRFRTTVYKYSA